MLQLKKQKVNPSVTSLECKRDGKNLVGTCRMEWKFRVDDIRCSCASVCWWIITDHLSGPGQQSVQYVCVQPFTFLVCGKLVPQPLLGCLVVSE